MVNLRRSLIFLAVVYLGFAEWQTYGGPYCALDLIDMGVTNLNGHTVIYAVHLNQGITKTTDGGLNWVCLPTGDCSQLVKSVAVHPNAEILYKVVSACDPCPAEVLKSTNGGYTWFSSSEGLPISFLPERFAIFPYAPNQLVLGTENDDFSDIYYSDDGGDYWQQADLAGNDVAISDFTILSLGRIYASAKWGDYPGVYYSDNFGHSWARLQNQPLRTDLTCIAVDADGYIYVGFGVHKDPPEQYTGGIERSTDWGLTWQVVQSIDNFTVRDILIQPGNPNVVYAAIGEYGIHSEGQGILRTVNRGAPGSWLPYNNGLAEKYVYSLGADPVVTNLLYAGTGRGFYQCDLNFAPYAWEERVRGMVPVLPCAAGDAIFPRLPNVYLIGDHCVYKSENSASSWSTVSALSTGLETNHSGGMNPLNNDVMLVGWGFLQPSFLHPRLNKSVDGGISWGTPKWQDANGQAPIYKIAYAHADTSFIYAGLGWDYLLLKSTDAGEHWQSIVGPPEFWALTDIAVHPDNEDVLYVSDGGGHRVYLSTDGGSNWHERSGNLPQSSIRRLKMDPSCPDILYTGYAGTWYGIWKTMDAGNNWIYSGLDQHNIYDLIIDPEEPTILYAATYDGMDCQVFMSVDRASEWFDISQGLPNKPVFNFGIDPASPDVTFGANLWGTYFYTVPFNKSLVSSSDTATSYNNSRKMVRVENTDEIFITYESGGVIYAVQSLNAGGSWSRKMEIGEGCHPALALYPYGDPPLWLPSITWRGTDGISIYFSRYDGMSWSTPTPIYQGSPGISIGPPSFTISIGPSLPIGHVAFNTYEIMGFNRILYGNFPIYDPGPVSTVTLDNGNVGLVSIDYNIGLDQIHVVYDYESWIITRYSADGGSNWSSQESVSQIDGNHYPSIEAVGSGIHFFWEGVGPNNQPDILCRYRYWDGMSWWWSEVMRVNYSDGASKYPTSAGGFSCCWSEYTGSNWETFLSRYDPMTGQWRPPVNISSSTERSMFSHLNLQQAMTGIIRYFITYTERDQAPYDIAFKTYIPPSEPDQPFYVGDVGQENPGPFNLKRSGYISYGKESYKTIDFDTDYLYYKMGKLNPKKCYKIEGVFYHENSQSCDLVAEVDGKGVGRITVPPKTIKRLKALLPVELYQDSVIYAKTKSLNGCSVLGVLLAYEYENLKVSAGGGGGTQSVETSLLLPNDFAISSSPNPFRNTTRIRFQLPVNCRVSLEIYDACGKRVQRLAKGERKAGYYALNWDAKDERGNALSNGVYFCKIRAGNFDQTKKLLLFR